VSNSDPNQPLAFKPLNPTLASNSDFAEVMALMEPAALQKHISEGNVHFPPQAVSPALNTQATAFTPSPTTAED